MSLMDEFVEVKLKKDDDFLKIKETLTRIGIASKTSNTLFQTCHILHKQGRYYIMMFKELFILDGKSADITDDDIARRNTIINLLQDWGLLDIVDVEMVKSPKAGVNQIKILPHSEKADWNLVSKYTVGNKR